MGLEKLGTVHSLNLLRRIDAKLIDLLKSLSLEEWSMQTLAPKWTVKDVAVHLLDGNLRTLSMLRDQYYGEPPAEVVSYGGLVAYLNKLNADWIAATKRLSPLVIIDLLEKSGKQYCDYLASLDPDGKAEFSVAWAGEEESKNWFHIAREYTEKWHHQQQIRLATGKVDDFLDSEFYYLYLDTTVRALPFHYRVIIGEDKDVIKFVFQAKEDKVWFLKWYENKWELCVFCDQIPTAEVFIQDEIAWQIFTKGIDRIKALKQSQLHGNKKLGNHIFELTAIMG